MIERLKQSVRRLAGKPVAEVPHSYRLHEAERHKPMDKRDMFRFVLKPDSGNSETIMLILPCPLKADERADIEEIFGGLLDYVTEDSEGDQ